MPTKLPAELDAFIQNGEGTFHCDDGDWDLAIIPGEKSGFSKELPKGALMIAENGCGDCLFLKQSSNGKTGDKVFVYWHEEQRSETFAPNLKKLIDSSSEPKKEPAPPPSAKSKGVSLADLEKAFGNSKSGHLYEKLKKLKTASFGVEALPLLRKALAIDDVQVAIEAAECIAKLGPAARQAAEDDGDAFELESELFVIGSKVWSYSLYCNCYSACLAAMQKIGADEDLILEYVSHNIGNESGDDLLRSLRALQAIGSRDAKNLIRRAATFWSSELNVREQKELQKILKA